MALEIVWTVNAKNGFDSIVDYLSKHWTEKEVQNFVKQTFKTLDSLSEFPELLEGLGKSNYLRRGPINKYTVLTYRIKPRKKRIELVHIRGSRQLPLK